ncbi:MAG: 3-phosphoshikimate 1-carboxyvinyltransferase [Nitrososphaerota archaeon]|nr:3-phosphoshikimate 1-carboxyvinyltransferase [Nitrososphaerales archaeon]MDW8044165.1 3-phosphoshikimate 1-carboxyvinyltransferase [Nitrososphaerota archaeon]
MRVFRSELSGTIIAPPSKSYTHRALILSMLSDGRSVITNPLYSQDTCATINACKSLGAEIFEEGERVVVKGRSILNPPDDIINVENSGTTLRIITAVSSLTSSGYTVITGDASIRRRPMQPLLDALNQLGVECWSSRLNGLPPIIVKGGGMQGGYAEVRGDVSSQFISALLISSPKAKKETFIRVTGKRVSQPYVKATLEMIRRYGGRVIEEGDSYRIPPNQEYAPYDFRVPGDFSSISFILAAGALSGGRVVVEGLDFSLPQADMKIIDILKRMGANIDADEQRGYVVIEGGELIGGEFDLSDSPDLLPVVAILGLKAKGGVRVHSVAHARFKESDRIANLALELTKLGVNVKELPDGLIIEESRDLKFAILDAHGDHRLFMAFCIAGLTSQNGCIVDGAETVSVSYPNFIKDITSLNGRLEVIND